MNSFTCPDCGATSHHPEDVRHGYCGACHAFTGRSASDEDRVLGRLPAPLVAGVIDIRRPKGTEVILTCPTCGLERRFPANWRELMGVDEIKCRADQVAMVEEAQ